MSIQKILPNSASFLISEDCNLACTYCFELDGRRSVHMTKEVARKGVKFLVDNALENGNDHIDVMFFGGEPWLKPDIVEEIFVYGLELTRKYNLRFYSSMVTNATILTEEIERIVRTYRDVANFNMQLSVDGIKEVHDTYRITRAGRGSFDTIEKNIWRWKALFADCPERLNIHGCSNHDTLPFLFENYLFFKEKWDFSSIWFMPIHSETWDDDDLRVYDEQLGKIRDYILDEIKRTGQLDALYGYAPLDRSLACDGFSSAPCGAGKFFVSFTAEGEIFPCHQFYFNDKEKETKIGDLDNGIDFQKVALFNNYGNEDLSCSKLDPDCDAYQCYRCIAENWGQNGSILSTVDCLGVRCKMSKIERKFQVELKEELIKMGLVNNGHNEQCNHEANENCTCKNRIGIDQYGNEFTNDDELEAILSGSSCGDCKGCDVEESAEKEEFYKAPEKPYSAHVHTPVKSERQSGSSSNEDDLLEVLNAILDKIDLLEKEQALILKKIL